MYPRRLLLALLLIKVATSAEDIPVVGETTTHSTPVSASSAPNAADHRISPMDKSYGQPPPPGTYYASAAAIPVPLPIQIQGGPLMIPAGMKHPPPPPPQQGQPPMMIQQHMYSQQSLNQQQKPIEASGPMLAEASQPVPQYQAFRAEAPQVTGEVLNAGDMGPANSMLLANHKSAPFVPGVDQPLESPTTSVGGSGLHGLPSDQWPRAAPEVPKIAQLDVRCEKDLMRVSIEFDRPFNGVIFSKGHYRSASCVHLPPGLGRQSATFDVGVAGCGMQGNSLTGLYGRGAAGGGGTFFENTIVIQYDPEVQEVWDQARKLRCSWHDQYEKSVTFRPFPVDMLDIVRADFAGDNVGCWMQIQVGKGPWASEVSGIVKIGQTMTMVLAIKDDDNKFDMLVRNCVAHDGKRPPIQLVDDQGCVVRPKVMSRFTKIRNFGSSASVLSYAHFQAFKFPDSMEVFFQCTIQICRYQCPEQCANSVDSPAFSEAAFSAHSQPAYGALAAGRPRDERDVSNVDLNAEVKPIEQTEVGVRRSIQVVSSGDFAVALDSNSTPSAPIIYSILADDPGLVCMSTLGFSATLVVLLAILSIACLLSAFLCLHQRAHRDLTCGKMAAFDPFSFVKKIRS